MQAFLLELLLYSGQYGTFYLLANCVNLGTVATFSEWSHAALLAALGAQCFLQSRHGGKPLPRLLLSLLVPSAYFAAEWIENPSGLSNMGHAFFWLFSLSTAAVHAFALRRATPPAKLFAEWFVSLANVSVFVFTYFYFDLVREYGIDGISGRALEAKLRVSEFPAGFAEFLEDPVHAYFLAGSLLLGVSTAFARARILSLQNRISELLASYVDSDIRDRLLAGKTIRSEKKTAAVMFSDIRGFTTLSETADPEELVRFLDAYFGLWSSLVRKNGGWVDKFIGDAVMAVFDKGDDGEKAVSALRCATEVLDSLDPLRTGIFKDGRIGIGIHFGTVVMGNVGSDLRRDYTVIGDVVNTASRLEGSCKEHGASLIASGEIVELAGSRFPLPYLGELEIRGKARTVRAYGK